MSGIINKVKDALHSDTENPNSASHGSHNKDTMNKADPRFDSDRDNRDIHSTTGHNTHNTGAHTGAHTGSHNTGAHSTGGIAPTHHSTTTGSTNDGPHNSSMMNKVDPRVDSDRDNRNDPLSKTGGYGHQENYGAQGANPMPSSGHQGQFGTTGTTGHSGVGSTGHSGLQSGAPSGPVYNGVTGAGAGHSGSNTAGPHNSSMMNKADPRVDSDRDNRNDPLSRTGGYGTQEGYGAQGSNPMPSSGHQGQYGQSGLGSTGTTGHHQTGPTGHAGTGHSATGQHGYGQDSHASHNTPGSGNAPSTAGPHNSNLLNKLDPRVDSNLDGSKTVGGNKTHT